jgi:transcription initiation factor TFIIIB Brf1 subunit/transcription initiation factor TFIIB
LELSQRCAGAGLLEDVAECAYAVFVDAASRPGWKPRKDETLRGLYSACVFHACCILRVHRTPRELAGDLRTDFKHFKNMIKATQSASQAVARARCDRGAAAATLDCAAVVGLLPRFAARLGMDAAEAWSLRRACDTTLEAVRGAICNHKPESVAAGLILHALPRLECVRAPTEAAASAACGVSVGTARSLCQKIAAELQRTAL